LSAWHGDRFATTLDCADIDFLPDGLLDELQLPAQTGTGAIAGIDLNKPLSPVFSSGTGAGAARLT